MTRLDLRVGDWIARRRGPEAGRVELGSRRVYILPTRSGLIFALAVLALLIGSINYGLALGYALCFFVAALALAGMPATHANLSRLRIAGQGAEPAFAGDHVHFLIELANPSPQPRRALRLAFESADKARGGLLVIDLAAQADDTVSVPLPAPHRGRLAAPRLVIETRYPLGLWRAWAQFQPALFALVYPRPEDEAPPLPAPGGEGERAGRPTPGGEDFAGARPYRAGDPPKTIAWRLAARSEELLVRQGETSAGGTLVLDWAQLPASLEAEAKLSRLTRWVLDAEAAELNYALALPGQFIAADAGPAQRERCLAALALARV